jgi:hypothetical protein
VFAAAPKQRNSVAEQTEGCAKAGIAVLNTAAEEQCATKSRFSLNKTGMKPLL